MGLGSKNDGVAYDNLVVDEVSLASSMLGGSGGLLVGSGLGAGSSATLAAPASAQLLFGAQPLALPVDSSVAAAFELLNSVTVGSADATPLAPTFHGSSVAASPMQLNALALNLATGEATEEEESEGTDSAFEQLGAGLLGSL